MDKAYFRLLHHTNQCELVFLLKLGDDDGKIIIEKEVRSVRQCTDTVASLIDHTRNKILKMLEKQPAEMEIPITITRNGNEVPGDTVCKVLVEISKKLQFTICQQTFEVELNAPLVHSVNLPVIIYVGSCVQPTKFRTLYADKQLCEFFWYKSLDKVTWIQTGTRFKYKPVIPDLNHYLKFYCIPKNANAVGPPFETVTETPVQELPDLPTCPFQERHTFTQEWPSGKNIRIVSYNTLSNRYSETNSQFPYCSPQALSVEYRKQLILKELLGYNADVICLQEMDIHIYQSYFKHQLSNTHKSVFHKKGNRIPEGLACFFNHSRYTMVDSKHIVLGMEVRSNLLFKNKWNLIKQSDGLRDSVIKQPTSLQVTVLQSKLFKEIIVVANTHLYYHSEANSIRLIQSSLALDYIKSIASRYRRTNCRVSVIFCGDFNSTPTSSVYEFFTKGVLQHTFQMENEPPLRNICFKHPFKFESACGTPKYTNYTGDFKGCLDYIFYDKTNFRVTSFVPLPNESILAEKIALPNEVFPSDHLALVANLALL